MPPDVAALWTWLPLGYALTVALEAPVLLVGLSARHSWARRLGAAVWLTAVTYPIVVVALPLLMWRFDRLAYFLVAETFAIAVECVLVRRVLGGTWPDVACVAIANIVSATIGELIWRDW